MIKVTHLTKRFGKTTAVSDLSFEVGKGEIVGLLGSNGAGKTTTLRILACYLPATGGNVTIGGHDVFTDSMAVRKIVGYLPEGVPLYPEMRVIEHLRFTARIKGIHSRKERSERIHDVISACCLNDVEHRLVGQLSKGYRRRVALAACLVNKPEILILDEPTLGLDPAQRRQFWALLRNLSHPHTVLLSTHLLSEVENVCQRVLIMNKGRVVASDSPRNLAGTVTGGRRLSVELQAPREAAMKQLRAISGVTGLSCEPQGAWHKFLVETQSGSDVRQQIFETVVNNDWSLREIRSEHGTLEDVFVAVTEESGLE